ncbi:MAG: Nramp family divalent metal transporter [Desulfuromonadaceae bacterium]|nr:Nramp family divalent metal transporter [Desulfuromonadaceae bacterium]
MNAKEDKDKKRDDGFPELEALELPKMNFSGMVRNFGPGIILMMTGIGTSHIITAPTAGGRFGYDLLWVIPLAYILKYYGYEMAIRFTNATGKSIMEAYATAWMKWPLWYMLLTTLIQCCIGQAGRLIAAAAVTYYIFSVYFGLPLSMGVYALFLALLSVTIILRGGYHAVETACKWLAGILIVSQLMIYLVEPAPLSAFRHFAILDTPEGSWIIISAFLGLLPTGMDVSLQASEWVRAKKAGVVNIRPLLEDLNLAPRFDPFAPAKKDLAVDMGRLPPHAREYCRRWMKTSLSDYRCGQIVSFASACIFLLIAAIWIFPGHNSADIAADYPKIFAVGPWMMIVLLLGVFAAAFSTAFNYFDGWPRVVGACCRNLFRKTAELPGIAQADLTPAKRGTWYSEYNIYRLTMLFSLATSVIIILGGPKPTAIVLTASLLAVIIAPVIFFLNLYYCFSIIPKDNREWYPSPLAAFFAWGSCLIFTGVSIVLMVTRFLHLD